MKTIILSILALICISKNSIAQEVDIIDSLTQTPQEQFEYLSANLDLSAVTTGLLADKCLPLIAYKNYDGQHLADSNYASAFKFGKLYATLRDFKQHAHQFNLYLTTSQFLY
jgi:hypothetical protein